MWPGITVIIAWLDRQLSCCPIATLRAARPKQLSIVIAVQVDTVFLWQFLEMAYKIFIMGNYIYKLLKVCFIDDFMAQETIKIEGLLGR